MENTPQPERDRSPATAGLRITQAPKTLRELAYENMRTAIFTWYFKPGDRLIERALTEELGVSRSIVREVIRKLETEGLVEVLPRVGPIVAKIDREKARQIYEVRGSLEELAVRACAEKITDDNLDVLQELLKQLKEASNNNVPQEVLAVTTEFYRTIFISAGKEFAWEMVQSVNARITQLRAMTISSPNRFAKSIPEMEKILNAIADGNPDAAARASWEHIEEVAKIAEQVLPDDP
ncbi:GntR family transcriptional regulator [Ruegeria arenilitoris]|uniref:GntR family transcriptional regulator n=1 Tax=Ruegeria arenilitoris TaxID=1173585 RepID=UPI00147CE702|nr:GntR family transcriptional regulator [Ruegeria arenilitoris]